VLADADNVGILCQRRASTQLGRDAVLADPI
jgi:hypothetical protein